MRRYRAKQKQLLAVLENEAENETEFGGGEVRNTIVSCVVAVVAVEADADDDLEDELEDDLEETEGMDFTESDKLAKELGQLETTNEEDSSDDGDSLATPVHSLVDTDKEDDSPMFGRSSKYTKRKKPLEKQRSSKRTRR